VELLRASLAELGLSPRRHGDVPPTPAVQRIAHVHADTPSNQHHLSIQVGPAMVVSPGGFGVAGDGFIGVRFRANRTWGVDAWTLLPVVATRTEQPEGSASLSPLLAGLDAALWIFEPSKQWQLSLAGGIGVARLGINGQAAPPRAGKSDPLLVVLPFGRVSVLRGLSERLAVGLDAFAGVAMPEPIVRFEGRPVADWGRPTTAFALSLAAVLD
jgi:hypothetical protein